jgi:HNH endonuclease
MPTRKDKPITKEQIIAALRRAARKLRHTPTSREFRELTGISFYRVAWRFGTFSRAVSVAGLKLNQGGVRIEGAALLEDWGNVVRKLGAVPSSNEYHRLGTYSRHCFPKRFQRWSLVPAAFLRSVSNGGIIGDWTDVLEKIRQGPWPGWGGCNGLAKRRREVRAAYAAQAQQAAASTEATALTDAVETQGKETRRHEGITAVARFLPPPLLGKRCVTATMLAVFVAELAPSALQWITGACFPRRTLQDRPLLGAPARLPGLAYEPVNEMGVMMLFAMMSRQMGFIVESVQAGFPDCEAKMEVELGRWQHVRIEFEYESRAFKEHRHDARRCDVIVCWRHNWKSCPPNLQVLELRRMVKRIQNSAIDE